MEIIEEASEETKTAKSFMEDLDAEGELEKAKTHGQFARIFVLTDFFFEMPHPSLPFCPCCQSPGPFKSQVEKFTMSSKLRHLSHYGIGLFLYMFFTKILIFIFAGLSLAIYTPILVYFYTFSTYVADFCIDPSIRTQEYPCTSLNERSLDFTFNFSHEGVETYLDLAYFHRKQRFEQIIDYSLVNLFTIIVLFVVYLTLVVVKNLLVKESDFNQITPSDYSLMVSGIDDTLVNMENLRERLTINNISPQEINLTFRITSFIDLKREYVGLDKALKEAKRKRIKHVSLGCFKSLSVEQIEDKMNSLKEQIRSYLNSLENQEERDKMFTGTVFATFSDTTEFKAFYDNFPVSFLGYVLAYLKYFSLKYIFICSNREKLDNLSKMLEIYVEQAPEPTDINFENLGISRRSKFLRLCLTFLVTLSLLGLNGFVMFLLESQVDRQSDSGFTRYLVSSLNTLTIFTVNFITQQIIYYLSKYERNWSLTAFNLSLSVKLTLFTYINTAIVPITVMYLKEGVAMSEQLNQNLLTIFLGNVVQSPSVFILDVFHFYKIYQRSQIEAFYKENGFVNKTQRELNEIYENVDIQIANKFAYLAKTLLITFTFSTIFPLAVPFALLALVAHFYTERYLIANRYKKPLNINKSIAEFYVEWFKVTVFLLGLFDFLWVRSSFTLSRYSTVNLILSSVILVVPFHSFMPKHFRLSNVDFLKKKWDEVFYMLDADYERVNPITRNKGLRKYLDKLKEKSLISENDFKNAAEMLEENRKSSLHEYFKSTVQRLATTGIHYNRKTAIRALKTSKTRRELLKKQSRAMLISSIVFIEDNDRAKQFGRRTMFNNLPKKGEESSLKE